MNKTMFGTKARWRNWWSNYPFIIIPILGLILVFFGPLSKYIGWHLIAYSGVGVILIGGIGGFFLLIKTANHANPRVRKLFWITVVEIILILLKLTGL